jgi:hypothetical protein
MVWFDAGGSASKPTSAAGVSSTESRGSVERLCRVGAEEGWIISLPDVPRAESKIVESSGETISVKEIGLNEPI